MQSTLEERLCSLGITEPYDSFSAPLIEKLLGLVARSRNASDDEPTNLSDLTTMDIANQVDDKIIELYQEIARLKNENRSLLENVFLHA